jgi:hypothetical protein
MHSGAPFVVLTGAAKKYPQVILDWLEWYSGVVLATDSGQGGKQLNYRYRPACLDY